VVENNNILTIVISLFHLTCVQEMEYDSKNLILLLSPSKKDNQVELQLGGKHIENFEDVYHLKIVPPPNYKLRISNGEQAFYILIIELFPSS